MPAPEQPSRQRPVWEVRARQINASHKPWQVLRVEARSVIQAEAILRRLGYEMEAGTAVRSAGRADSIGPAELTLPACSSCGYQLSGLVIEKFWVRCPECSFQQPLIAWKPGMDAEQPRMGWAMLVLATIGGVVVASVLCWSVAVVLAEW